MVVVQLVCERCKREYEGERPAFWVERAPTGTTWVSTACERCEPIIERERAEFRERTKLTYQPRRRGKGTTVDVVEPEEQPGFFKKEEDDDERDKYWQ